MMKKLLMNQPAARRRAENPEPQKYCRSGPSQDLIKVKNPESPAMRRAREGTL
jgi:hypothetical protein